MKNEKGEIGKLYCLYQYSWQINHICLIKKFNPSFYHKLLKFQKTQKLKSTQKFKIETPPWGSKVLN